MKRFALMIVIGLMTIAVYGQEKAAEEKKAEDKKIGLAVSANYFSNYLWRGTEFYNRGGALVPAIAWTPFDLGLTLTVASEISTDYLWNGFIKKPDAPRSVKGYYYTGSSWLRKKPKINSIAYSLHSLDFGADYSYTIKDAVTIGAGLWFWWYYNSASAKEMGRMKIANFTPAAGPLAGTALGLNKYQNLDVSFISPSFFIALPIVPFINPKVTVTADYYTGLKRGMDWYVQMSLGHDFSLSKEVTLALGLVASYYYAMSTELTNYYYDDTLAWTANTRGWWRQRTPLKKGFSDVTPSVALKYSKGMASLNAAFNWVMVPSKSWYKGSSVHRYYAQLGGTLSF